MRFLFYAVCIAVIYTPAKVWALTQESAAKRCHERIALLKGQPKPFECEAFNVTYSGIIKVMEQAFEHLRKPLAVKDVFMHRTACDTAFKAGTALVDVLKDSCQKYTEGMHDPKGEGAQKEDAMQTSSQEDPLNASKAEKDAQNTDAQKKDVLTNQTVLNEAHQDVSKSPGDSVAQGDKLLENKTPKVEA